MAVTLPSGARLGPYEIVSRLGAGGMGEVYKARDTRLDRTVAIKSLRSADPDLRQRFEREARAISALDHAHICALYDVHEQNGQQFLVMQYVEGETLAERLTRGALPLDQALRYAIEIADALAHAHRHGIVHRDLKPANVMLTKSGVKLLDFGLAKLQRPAGEAAGDTLAMTARGGVTAEGTILGTLHYIAPEQLEGKAADARSDLFAFGVVLYEMMTGTKAFDGTSPATIIAAILNSEPPAPSTRKPLTPPALDRIVASCLAKDPEERWQSAADLARALRWIADGGAVAGRGIAASRPAWTRRTTLAWAVLGLVALGAIGGALAWTRVFRGTSSSPRVVRFVAVPSATQYLFALSPDGSRIAYSIPRDDKSPLFLRSFDELDGKLIADNGIAPFFSPDGRWVGYTNDSGLMKVAVSGGAPQLICTMPGGWGATWTDDGTIVFSPSATSGLYRVPSNGGTPAALTVLATGEKSHRWPQFLPGGKHIVFTVQTPQMTSLDDARVAVVSLDTRQRRGLFQGGINPLFVSTGHLLYVRSGSLVGVPFDLRRLETIGQPVTLLDGISTGASGPARVSVAENGSLAYVRGSGDDSNGRVVWVDQQGAASPVSDDVRLFGTGPRLAPDGQRIALEVVGPNDQIWIYDLARRTFSRLTSESNNASATWTPDGKRITFWSDRSGVYNLYWQPADGSGPAERLTESSYKQAPGSWTPDGKQFAFTQEAPSGTYEIWTLTLAPERRVRPLIQTAYDTQSPTISPNGRWLAYISRETGRNELYVQPFPGLGAKWQISSEGAWAPRWARPLGRELYYQNGDKMMAVAIRPGPTFVASAPRVVFTGQHDEGYDVAGDGRFVLVERPKSEPDSQILLVQNWFQELKQRMRQ